MTKLPPLLIALAAAGLLAGCQLYFGSSNDTWSYCGSDGYYKCEGNDCYWAAAECPAGVGSGAPPGFGCQSHTDCAAGCYCADNGICEEAGFCTNDTDCGNGYTCNTDRSSCEPVGPCTSDASCDEGSYCSPDTNECTASCTCASDEEAIENGFGWCDESRNTCMPGQDPAGTCAGTPTCNVAKPSCPAGQVPTLYDGCYTGECREYAACDMEPVCAHINDQTNCLGRNDDCAAVYTGLNCTKPDGTACQAGDTGCTCQSFVFHSCRDKNAGSPRLVQTSDGLWLDATPLMLLQ
jgi:hypothetical protein